MARGNVTTDQFQVDEVPKFPRQERAPGSVVLQQAVQAPVGITCIRQYDSRDSASSAMYNLRKQITESGQNGQDLPEMEVAIGPIQNGERVGLFVTKN